RRSSACWTSTPAGYSAPPGRRSGLTKWRSARAGASSPPATATAVPTYGTPPPRSGSAGCSSLPCPVRRRVRHLGSILSPSARPARPTEGHRLAVTAVAFTADGRTLATGGRDDTVRLWDVATARELEVWALPAPKSAQVAGLALATGGRALAAYHYEDEWVRL